MDIVVKGRHVEVPEHFRNHVEEKLARSERYDHKIIRVDVELSHETNPRQSKACQRVQITLVSRGPAIRAGSHCRQLLRRAEKSVDKLEGRLRRASERRHDRYTARQPIAGLVPVGGPEMTPPPDGPANLDGDLELDGDGEATGPGRIVRVKDHPAEPITVDQALYQMELVGHDFYLFNDADTGLGSVVYRRKGFDYGLLRLS